MKQSKKGATKGSIKTFGKKASKTMNLNKMKGKMKTMKGGAY